MPQTLKDTVYFDHAATTPTLPSALEAYQSTSRDFFGNASSSHKRGRQALEVVTRSTERFARYFGVPSSQVVFTSGGTESINLALWGALGGLVLGSKWLKEFGNKNEAQILTTALEHSAVASVASAFSDLGAGVATIGVDQEGMIDFSELEKIVSVNKPKLLTLHHIQNEVGALQNIAELCQIVRALSPNTIIHVDAVQSFMKVPTDFAALGADMISVSAHKIGGPKGVGALVLGKRFEKRIPKIAPFLLGSTQQSGMRPGTIPVPLIASFAAAVEYRQSHLDKYQSQVCAIRDAIQNGLPNRAVVNGPKNATKRAHHILNFSLPGLPSAVSVEALSNLGFFVSAGSACHSTSPKPNASLVQMQASREVALSSVRVSFSDSNTLDEAKRFLIALDDVLNQYGSLGGRF